jgi:threonine dehydrogenase-like Zn-dependent dehydrogenase
MKALLYTKPHRLELQDLPTPVGKPHEALVRIRAVGVCGSDLDGFLGRSKKRVPPLVLGHEFSGQIEEVGDEVSGFSLGEGVAVYPLIACGQCQYCKIGRHNICPQRKVFGLDFHGGLAEYASVPEECLFRIPPTMTYTEAALVEPLANAVHVMGRCPDVEDQTGLVYGCGPIGLFVFLTAKHFGARRLAVVDLNPRRLAVVKDLGADLVVNASEQRPVDAILEWTGGRGVDFAVDAVGNSICRQNAIACTAFGGTMVWIGLGEDICEIDGRAIVTRELEVKGSYAYAKQDFARAIALLEQKVIPITSFISEARLDQGQSVFGELTSGRTAMMKVIFKL